MGTQYRSAIFYTTPEQKKDAEEFIKGINASNKLGKPVVTEVVPLDVFYVAENYHHDYFATHSENPYCEMVINPKLEKVQKRICEVGEGHRQRQAIEVQPLFRFWVEPLKACCCRQTSCAILHL